jgi:hypothetical protein
VEPLTDDRNKIMGMVSNEKVIIFALNLLALQLSILYKLDGGISISNQINKYEKIKFIWNTSISNIFAFRM